MQRAASTIVLASLLSVLSGCPATVGGTQCTEEGTEVICVRREAPGCDELSTDAARYVVYRDDGEPYYGIPASGKRITINGTAILRMRDGKVVEHWGGPHCMNGIGLSSDGAVHAEPAPLEGHPPL